VVLLDAADSVLLVQEREAESEVRWLTPGGGLEAGETPAEAAVRELYEETGIVIRLAPQAAPWHVDRYVWTIAGELYDQTNHYFLVRLPDLHRPVRPTALTELEQSIVLGSRWWTMGDLGATEDAIWPAELPVLLARELAA
jgi:8-oxo-dGTP pyrophosphatase MutT (NUDIX family)